MEEVGRWRLRFLLRVEQGQLLYGAMIASLVPVLRAWWREPTSLSWQSAGVPAWLGVGVTVMAVGVVLSGLRDLYAALGLPGGGWPWAANHRIETLR